jgi:hypothetical protein
MTRPLTDSDRNSIVKKLFGGWDLIIDDAVDVFDRANFVAGNDTRSPIGEAVRSLTRFNCRRWARGVSGEFSPAVNQANANICGQYLDSISERPSPGSIGPELPGGQCVGVSYSVVLSYVGNSERCPGATASPTNLNSERTLGPIFGPISDVGIEPTVTGNCGFQGAQFYVQGFNGAGEPLKLTQGAVGTGRSDMRYRHFSHNVVSIARTDGLPDDCGALAPRIVPPTPLPGLPALPNPSPITLPGFGTVPVEVTLNPDGTFTVSLPTLDSEFVVDLSGGAGATPGGDGGLGGLPPGDVGTPVDPVATDSEGEADGEAPEGSVIGALKIDVVSAPNTAKTFVGGVFRAVCYIYMGTDDGLDMHPDGALMVAAQLVLPKKDNLTKWKVQANPGYDLNVTPFYFEVNEL